MYSHLSGTGVEYVCSCPLFYRYLCCPATVYLDDKFRPEFSIDALIENVYGVGRNTHIRAPNRNRQPRNREPVFDEQLWGAIGLRNNFESRKLFFLSLQQRKTIAAACRIRNISIRNSLFAQPHRSKTASILYLIRGTYLATELAVSASAHADRLNTIFNPPNSITGMNLFRGVLDSVARNPTTYQRVFDPFPEGICDLPDISCTTYMVYTRVTPPNCVNGLPVYAFLVAGKHAISQGSLTTQGSGML